MGSRLRALLCFVLLSASAFPLAVGHDDNGSRAGDVDGGVAGTFYGPAGYAVSFDGQTQNLPEPVGPVSPDFLSYAYQIWCDLEVIGDGSSYQEPDESRVEGHATGVGLLTDGTFDDGGHGGACHTNNYGFDNYDTPGCSDDGARASNPSPLAAPWIGASCDWKTIIGGTPNPDVFRGCASHSANKYNGRPWGITYYPGCIPRFIACTTSPLTCLQPGLESCGSDGVPDGINFGFGSTRVAYPFSTPVGTSYTDDGLWCSRNDAVMVAYLFNGVLVTSVGTSITHKEYPAIQGDVWQVA